MSERTDKAIARITEEMMAIGTRTARRIEEYLTNKCTNDLIAEKLLDEDKTLKGCVAFCTKKAEPQRDGQSAMVEDEEVFEWIEEYYGITDIGVPVLKEVTNDAPAAKVDLLSLF